MVWSKNENEPLHGSLDHLALYLMYFVFLDALQLFHGSLDGFGCLDLHLPISMLHTPTANTIRLGIFFVDGDQIVNDVV